MRALVLTVCAAIGLAACEPASTLPWQPTAISAPNGTHVVLTGEFTFSQRGELTLALDEPCRLDRFSAYRAPIDQSVKECDQAHLDAIPVVAATPWGYRARGQWKDAGHIVFHVPWAESGLDPLADDAAALAAQPWGVAGISWVPSPDEARRIVRLVGDATDTEADYVRGGPPPELHVTGFQVVEGSLQAGNTGTLQISIANHGAGAAYRVIATTRSSVTSLHGLRIGFGVIKPGAEKVRRYKVRVPVTESSPDTMLVLAIGEGNGFAPPNSSRRVAIRPVAAAPVLALACLIVGRSGDAPALDAGESVDLRCTLDNTAGVTADAELLVSIAGGAVTMSEPHSIDVGGRVVIDVPLTIPRDLALDSTVQINATARDRHFQRAVSVVLHGVVRKPKLCNSGQLTRAQYNGKIAELRAAVAAGDMTQDELDRYDAELVGCLQ
jgi:hypothetical protein